ncbi:hypothetical protein NLG97_g8481 [Lecanicillium saksenae]|uniref:Uncharacterized protein n=1 Tax=Lecanicillium saksenae TaxID=468837 RepID=A0ACC1QMN0_9HYPO|nr:hypothetical protein NLG97_g8481 [Lecanicillium saksenae]
MAIDQSSTPTTGARGRRHFPEGFHYEAQEKLLTGAAPVITRPFLPSSSPVRRRSTSATRNRQRHHRHQGKGRNPNANYYDVLAEGEDGIVSAFDAIDLETETQRIITKEKERMNTRTEVLRTFAESIATCARKFDHGYAHAVANDFTKSLLRHWNQFLHSGGSTGYSINPPEPELQTTKTTAIRPAADEQPPRAKAVSFADITKAAAHQTPGDVRIAPKRRQPVAASNYTDRRVLLRLKDGSSFFEKEPYQIGRAILEKLTLKTHDIQTISATNTGWSIVARNAEIQAKILETQEQWGPSVDLDIAEKQVTWYTYLIKDFPSELRSYDETILDFSETVSEEIVAQTGQTPVQWRRSSKPSPDPTKTTLVISFVKPIRGNFRLLSLGTYSFLLTKPKQLVQCQNCWQFHTPVRCIATRTCRTCGVTDRHHDTESCKATPRCANCHGPHYADNEKCYARPKKVGDTHHKLSRSQRIHARKLGANDYERQNMENIIQSSSSPPTQSTEIAMADGVPEVYTDIMPIAAEDADGNNATPPQAENPPAEGSEEIIDEVMGGTEEEYPWNSGNDTEGDFEVATTREPLEQQHQAPRGMETAESEEAAEEDEQTREDEAAEDEEAAKDSDEAETEEEAEEERHDDDKDKDSGNDDCEADVCDNSTEEEAQPRQNDGSEMKNTRGSFGDAVTVQQLQPSRTSRTTTARPSTTTRKPVATYGRTTRPMTAVKKRFLTTYSMGKIIPSDNTNPSSDPPTADMIQVRTSPTHSPPSSPPQEARRREQSPAKRQRNDTLRANE